MAAAIKANANIIVTNSLKDFPKEYLETFGLGVKSVDDFLTDIIDLNPQVYREGDSVPSESQDKVTMSGHICNRVFCVYLGLEQEGGDLGW